MPCADESMIASGAAFSILEHLISNFDWCASPALVFRLESTGDIGTRLPFVVISKRSLVRQR